MAVQAKRTAAIIVGHVDNRTQPDSNLVKTITPTSANAVMHDDSLDAKQWQRYIEQEIGFVLPDVQLQWLINAIDHTAMSRGLTAKKLWYQLPKNDELRQQLLDKVLIHESRFFRHKPSIDFVTECALQHQHQRLQMTATAVERPDSVEKAHHFEHANDANCHNDGLFRIWSVGCASGQETWSIAMSLASKLLTDFAILGTDVSEQALKKATLAQYGKRQQSLIPQSCQPFIYPLPANKTNDESATFETTNVEPSTTTTKQHWQVAPHLQQYVSFALHNIIEQQPPTAHLQQVIICQNMLLYFRKFDQRDILARLSEQCAVGGYIILAPGEALFWRPANMRRIAHPQVNVWQKIKT